MITRDRTPRPELLDTALLDDAAQRVRGSGQALFEYYSRLDTLRDFEADLGRDVLAERAARAELRTRVLLSAGLDALNELHDLGLVEDCVRTAINDPDVINRTTLTEAVRRCAEMLTQRFPDQQWAWLEGVGSLLADVDLRVEPEGGNLRATVTQKDHQNVMHVSPAAGLRTDAQAFFSDGPNRIYIPASAAWEPAPESEPMMAVSAYDSAITGLAFLREWAYRHARNADEIGAPDRTGSTGAEVAAIIGYAIVIALAAGAVMVVGAGIAYLICKTGGVEEACSVANILLAAGLFSMSLGGSLAGYQAINQGQTPYFNYGTNPSPTQ